MGKKKVWSCAVYQLKVVERPSKNKRCNTPHLDRYEVLSRQMRDSHSLNKNECCPLSSCLKTSTFSIGTVRKTLSNMSDQRQNANRNKFSNFSLTNNTHSVRYCNNINVYHMRN